ncbi:Hsp20/alpha crystallin family protein [Nakamurella sp. PAMC28650]|uniref:Hsp20/alpha crystallin family protein n=1 Tax=Nakamurella sp. PAMC28650 TaxID=2762325 RepID=UPI00164E6764|nr:HSP20 family small heat-shock protein [Nakamurella sp. PAMC28650]QNK83233.1 Hsp20 family protein [Nakamurella sp. PAMC28650]
MLMRTDPFREFDRLSQQVFGTPGTLARPSAMPMDAWREGHEFVVEFDLPGVDPDSIDLDVERNVLTVRAERTPAQGDREFVAAERPRGVFSRQLILGDTLDTDRVRAAYDGGVLTLRIPVAEKAKPRKIRIDQPAQQDRPLVDA